MDGAYTLGVTLDLHYAYMVGLPGQGGWPDWNAGGTFVNILADSADAKGVTPMYTLYAMASIGDGNLSGLATDSFMRAVLGRRAPAVPADRRVRQAGAGARRARLLGLRAADVGRQPGAACPCTSPAWCPSARACPTICAGLGHCILKLGAHAGAQGGDRLPRLALGGQRRRHGVVPERRRRRRGRRHRAGHAGSRRRLLRGPRRSDLPAQRRPLVLGRDQPDRRPTFTSTWTGRRRSASAWASRSSGGRCRSACPARRRAARPGTTATTACTTSSATSREFVAAGGLGITFGAGAGNQTYITTDGGQFKNAVTAYFAAPVTLP